MQECHAAAVRAGHRRLMDQSESLPLQALQVRLEVFHAKTDVMNAFAALIDELRHGGVRRERLQQLEIRIADFDERGPDALSLDILDAIDSEAECVVDLCSR